MRHRSTYFRAVAAIISLGILACGTLHAESSGAAKRFYSDDPLWRMPDPVAVKQARARKLNEYYDFFANTLFSPGERAPRTGTYLPSQAINTVDEVPDSAWYTNRHARSRMSIEALRRGPGNTHPPAQGTWKVTAAKNEGITPGFRIEDSAGRRYLIKFDPLSNPEMASAADVISSKFFYALGYNVPENYIVHFERGQIVAGKGAMVMDGSGRKRPIRQHDIDEMLAKAPRGPDGKYRALASRLLPGKPVGPFRYNGTRPDDPNDLVPHEHRRDLRALRTFCAWLGHDDSKALNTLDVLVADGGTPHIRHYLIDFGASLGSASFEPNSPREGNTYLFSWKYSAAQFFSFGTYVPRWQRATYPKLPAAGRFEYETFDPERWVPDYPNAAFRNENPADRFWAARKILAFTDEEIRSVVETGEFSDAAAADWIARCLIERRDKIGRAFASGVTAWDNFDIRSGALTFRANGPWAAPAGSIRVHWAIFDNDSGAVSPLPGEESLRVPVVATADYLVATLQGSRGDAVSVYVSRKQSESRVIGVEHHFTPLGRDR